MVRYVFRLGDRKASAPIIATAVCVLALAFLLGACSGGGSTPSSEMPVQLSPEQILAGILAVTGQVKGEGGEVLVEQEGDILLEPAGAAGPESFAGERNVGGGPTPPF